MCNRRRLMCNRRRLMPNRRRLMPKRRRLMPNRRRLRPNRRRLRPNRWRLMCNRRRLVVHWWRVAAVDGPPTSSAFWGVTATGPQRPSLPPTGRRSRRQSCRPRRAAEDPRRDPQPTAVGAPPPALRGFLSDISSKGPPPQDRGTEGPPPPPPAPQVPLHTAAPVTPPPPSQAIGPRSPPRRRRGGPPLPTPLPPVRSSFVLPLCLRGCSTKAWHSPILCDSRDGSGRSLGECVAGRAEKTPTTSSGPLWGGAGGVRLNRACQGKGRGCGGLGIGQVHPGHEEVRGRWAPRPPEGKGSREGQGEVARGR